MAEKRALTHIRKRQPLAHYQVLSSWTGTGIFDCNQCTQGIENWIELKELSVPKTMRGKYRTKVRPAQIAWEHLRRKAGGRTWVACMVESQLYLLPGYCLKELRGGVTLEWLKQHRKSLDELMLK